MYPLGLSAHERRLFTRALRADVVDLRNDPDVGAVTDDRSEDDPKQGDTTTPAEVDPGTGGLRLVTANVQHTMTRAKIVADVKQVASLGSIIMWQEVHGGAYADAIRQYLPSESWQNLFIGHEITVSVKRSLWDVQQATAYRMHDRFPGGGDPARYLGVALVQSRTSSTQFLVANCHFVANAWNGAARPNRAWKQSRWQLTYDKFQALVADAQGKGLTVLGGGDWNKPAVPKFQTAQQWFRTAHVDYLFGVAASVGAQFTAGPSQSVALNSDHNALVQQVTLTAGTKAPVGGYYWPGL